MRSVHVNSCICDVQNCRLESSGSKLMRVVSAYSRTSWGGDRVLQHARVLPRLERHLGGAHDGLRGQLLGDIPREARSHAAVRERLDGDEYVRRAAAAETRHGAQ